MPSFGVTERSLVTFHRVVRDGPKNDHTAALIRGSLQDCSFLAHPIRCPRRAVFEGNHGVSRARRGGETFLVRLLHRSQGTPADWSNPKTGKQVKISARRVVVFKPSAV